VGEDEGLGSVITQIVGWKNIDPTCYEENIYMARGKPKQMEMNVEIKSNIIYAILTCMLARQDKILTSSRCSMKSTVEHLSQINTPATCPQQPRNARIW
jgi:hypothetical protein